MAPTKAIVQLSILKTVGVLVDDIVEVYLSGAHTAIMTRPMQIAVISTLLCVSHNLKCDVFQSGGVLFVASGGKLQ